MTADRARQHRTAANGSDLMRNLGMGEPTWDPETGEATATVRCEPEQLEADGSVPFGYLSVIADNNNAMANINTADWGVNSILVEVSYQAARPAHGTVETRSHNSAFNDTMGVAQGVMLDDEGRFGQSQCTSVTVPSRPQVGDRAELPQVEHVAFPWESVLEPAPVDLYLKGGLTIGEETVYTSRLDAGWASNYGSLHGGAIGLLLTRAARYAAIAASPEGAVQVPFSFHVNYFRPAMVGPDPMRATARVVALTTRFVTLEAEFVLPSGKPAARAKLVHRLQPPA